MSEKEQKISVIIPALNEEMTIASVISSVKPFCDELIVVDGQSIDRTENIAKKEGVISPQKNVATLPELSQQELANMIGASRETVSRILNSFQKQGLLAITRKQIILHNIKSLL